MLVPTLVEKVGIGMKLSNLAEPLNGEFRLYFMDPSSGHIEHVGKVTATDEPRVVSEALRQEWQGPVEVWGCGAR